MSALDPELVARRVNGAVAADLQAQELRTKYARERSEPDPSAIFRRLEAIEAAIYWLHDHERLPLRNGNGEADAA